MGRLKRTPRNAFNKVAITDGEDGFLGTVASEVRTRALATETPPDEESNLMSRLLSY